LTGFVEQTWLEANYYDQSEIDVIVEGITGALPIGANDGDIISWVTDHAEWVPNPKELPEYGTPETNGKYLFDNDGELMWLEAEGGGSVDDELLLPEGGDPETVLIKNAVQNGDARWDKINVGLNVQPGDEGTYVRTVVNGQDLQAQWVLPTFETKDGVPAVSADSPNVVYDTVSNLTYYKNNDNEYQIVGSLI
jgi:hypothetical protein